MRLRSIRLNEVRRFGGPVAVEGIGPGLNLLAAPNEAGKSTLFDALEAVFSLPHGSKAKGATALKPLAGGAPEVTVEIETAEGVFEIAKRWLSKPMAEIRSGGRVVARADEAEAWIARAMGEGPGGRGFLWVRQGATELDPKAWEARRDLLSSVSGEVDAMTGGPRMDAVRARCAEALAVHVTGGGRPKAGGPLKAAEDEVAALEARAASLADEAAALHDALEGRRRVKLALADLSDPEAEARRRAALAAARTAAETAHAHADTLESAGRAAELARLTLDASRRHRTQRRKAEAERAEAETAQRDRAEAETAAAAERARTGAALDAAKARETEATGVQEAAEAALRRARAAATAGEAARRREALEARLIRAEALRRMAETQTATAKRGPDAAALRRVDQAEETLRARREARAAGATAVTMRYAPEGAGGVTRDGEALPDGTRLAIPEGAVLTLRGLGTLRVEPGAGGADAAAVADAEAALKAALEAAGADDAEAARAAHARRAEAERAAADARARLDVEAPDGLEALRVALAALPDPAEDPDAPTVEDAQTAEAEARAAAREAAAARETAALEANRAALAAERADSDAAAARDRLTRAAAAAAAFADEDAAALDARIEAETEALRAAEARRDALADAAPDVEAAAAEFARAEGAVREAEAERARLEKEDVALTATIELRAGEAVEEELASTEERLAAAKARHARLSFEVRVLNRLADALDDARGAARDRWFAPVMEELRPLLSLIWEDAELGFDETAVLPATLTRAGGSEAFDILSGGTREQIAILVRLAFARMLARRGRAAPVILDDALVHSDDDRIERMFGALHRQAADLQILVLSCRQRAFRDLGARTLRLEAG